MGIFLLNKSIYGRHHFKPEKPMYKYWHHAKMAFQKYIFLQKWLLSAEFLGEAKTFTQVFLSEYYQMYVLCQEILKNLCKKCCQQSIIEFEIVKKSFNPKFSKTSNADSAQNI